MLVLLAVIEPYCWSSCVVEFKCLCSVEIVVFHSTCTIACFAGGSRRDTKKGCSALHVADPHPKGKPSTVDSEARKTTTKTTQVLSVRLNITST
jgi:hypothetical protein